MVYFLASNEFQLATFLTSMLIFLIVIKPLYKLSKSVEGLFLIFIDCSLQLSNAFLTVVGSLFNAARQPYWDQSIAVPATLGYASLVADLINDYVHDSFFGLLLIIALNRFNAIFFPFSYNRIWKPRNKKIFLLLDVLIATSYRIVLDYGIGNDHDSYYYVAAAYYSLCLYPSIIIYVLILIKFSRRCCCNPQAAEAVAPSELRQDRARIAFICFLTVLPWTFEEFFRGLFVLIVGPFVGCTNFTVRCAPLESYLANVFYVQLILSLPAQLSQVIGILALNRQFRLLLRAHILGGFQMLRRLFRLKHSGAAAAVHPSPPVAAIIVRPAREA